MREGEPDDRYQVRAVGRALDLLVLLGGLPTALDLTTLARRAELPASTAFRLLETLRSRGMVRVGRDGYRLGATLFELGGAFLRTVSVWNDAPELAERLATELDETASVGILDDGQVLYLAIAHGQSDTGMASVPGTRHPAHATALGKVLLAALPWPAAAAILERRPPVRLTETTCADPASLRAELERVAAQGYAMDAEERQPGVTCYGAPIRDRAGAVVAAISVSGPTFRMRQHGAERLIRAVRATADEASRRLGAPLPAPGPGRWAEEAVAGAAGLVEVAGR